MAALLVPAASCGASHSAYVATTTSTSPPTTEVPCESPGFEPGIDLVVFMEPDVRPEQIESVRTMLEADDRVLDSRFVDQEEALAEFADLFADQEHLVDAVTAETLPTSFRLDVTSADVSMLAEELRPVDGVREVVEAQSGCWRDRVTGIEGSLEDYAELPRLVIVYVQPGRGDARAEIGERVAALASGPVAWVDQADALVEFECLFAGEPDRKVAADELPPSFRFSTEPGEPTTALMNELAALDGVKDVVLEPLPESVPPDFENPEDVPFLDPRCRVAGEPYEP